MVDTFHPFLGKKPSNKHEERILSNHHRSNSDGIRDYFSSSRTFGNRTPVIFHVLKSRLGNARDANCDCRSNHPGGGSNTALVQKITKAPSETNRKGLGRFHYFSQYNCGKGTSGK